MYFEVQADDPVRAAEFYRQLFGWTVEPAAEPDLPVEYWRIHAEGLAGGLLKRPAPPPGPGHGTNAYVCSFEVADIEAAGERVVALGGAVALPTFAVPGRCWQGYFLDTEQNTFGLFQVDESAR